MFDGLEPKKIITSLFLMGIILVIAGCTTNVKEERVIQEQPLQETSKDITPSTDYGDISTWQTYTNDEFGFSVKYPPGWGIGTLNHDDYYKELGIYHQSGCDENTASPCLTSAVFINPVAHEYGVDDFLTHQREHGENLINFHFAGRDAIMIPGDDGKNWNRYQNIVQMGNGDMCEKYIYIGVRVLQPPATWKTRNEQIYILCEDKNFAPVLGEIVKSIEFTK